MKKYFSYKFNDSNLSLSERVLKQTLLAVTFISFFYAFLNGFVLKPNLGAFVNASISSIIFASLYFLSKDKKTHSYIIAAFVICCMIALSFNWVFTNGIQGGTSFLYLLLMGFYAIVAPRRQYIILIVLVILNVFFLALLEFYYPQYIAYDLSPNNLFMYTLSSIIVSLVITAWGIYLIKAEYEKEYRKSVEKEKRLVAANNARSRFLANISHEIRTPLNGVMGMASLLQDSKPTKEQEEYVQTIKISSNRLLKIINEILDYSKAEAGKTELRIENFSLTSAIDDAIQINMPKALEKKIALSYQLDKNIPDSLSGDGGKLQQILINLIGNAIKFTEKGSVELHIQKIATANQKIELQFDIHDTGIGIPKESIDNLFDAFTQVDDSRTRTQSGTGLGLAISKHFVELMDGSIWVNSTEHAGSTFSFTTKFDVLYNKSFLTEKPADATINHEIAQSTPFHILLVEDDKINRLLATRLLQKMGYRPDTANNGVEALRALHKEQYNLVLMDVQMPVMDGLETTELIRKELHYQPTIIAMTANAMPEDKALCEQVGMDDFLAKPIDIQSLENILIKWKSSI